MNLDTFRRERSPDWDALEHALRRGQMRSMTAEQVLAAGRSYRAAAADLALARRRFPGDPVVDRLERLVLMGRSAIYSEPARSRGALRAFATCRYWRLVHERRGVLAVAVLALLGPCVLAAVWALHDPAAAIGLVPARFRSASDPHVRHLPLGAATQAVLASSIFTNNIKVTFLAFAGGLTLGLGTLALLAYNGVLLGTLAGITIQAGSFPVFVRYVMPHGVLELSCIAVAGAAGLRIGWAIIDPGAQPRGASLRAQARPAVLVALGTAPWLIVAGLIEGFVTPRGLSLPAALALGLAVGGLYWVLVAVLGRGRVRGRGRDRGRDRRRRRARATAEPSASS